MEYHQSLPVDRETNADANGESRSRLIAADCAIDSRFRRDHSASIPRLRGSKERREEARNALAPTENNLVASFILAFELADPVGPFSLRLFPSAADD